MIRYNWVAWRYSETYKTVALGSASEFIGDNDSLQDIAVLIKVFSHGFFGCLPSQSSDKHFGQCRVTELSDIAVAVEVVHCRCSIGNPNPRIKNK